jgi:hypothetical protein
MSQKYLLSSASRIMPDQKRVPISAASLRSRLPNGSRRTTRLMARTQDVSQQSQLPHVVPSVRLARGPKSVDIVGLLVNPPDHVLVLSFDLQPAISPADRGTDRAGDSMGELLAALGRLDGAVAGDCKPSDRHGRLLLFLKQLDREMPKLVLHLLVESVGAKNHPQVRRWLHRHRARFRLSLKSKRGSWLDVAGAWLQGLTRQPLRPGAFRHLEDLTRFIGAYVGSREQKPRIFAWTASLERTPTKAGNRKAPSEAQTSKKPDLTNFP